MSASTSPDTDPVIEADKLLDLEEGDTVEYEAYDGDLLKHDSREKCTYRKEVTNVSRLSTESTHVYVHVEDPDTGERTIISAKTRHNHKGMLWRTGGIQETMGPYAGHPDSWTRTVNGLCRVNAADE